MDLQVCVRAAPSTSAARAGGSRRFLTVSLVQQRRSDLIKTIVTAYKVLSGQDWTEIASKVSLKVVLFIGEGNNAQVVLSFLISGSFAGTNHRGDLIFYVFSRGIASFSSSNSPSENQFIIYEPVDGMYFSCQEENMIGLAHKIKAFHFEARGGGVFYRGGGARPTSVNQQLN